MKGKSERLPVSEQIRKGLEEVIAHAKGEITLKTTKVELPDPPPSLEAKDVIRLREDNRMSQAVFARLLNVSTKTVQIWEQGVRQPSQAALRLIQVLAHNPSGLYSIARLTLPSDGAAPARSTHHPAQPLRRKVATAKKSARS